MSDLQVEVPVGWVSINIYRINRAFGGPEEGGWWYTYGEAERSMLVRKRNVDQATTRVSRVLDKWNEGVPPLGSVHCPGIYELRVQKHLARDFPGKTPHYE